eukprot:3844856-Pleurochrysis_carterae.AAC.4
MLACFTGGLRKDILTQRGTKIHETKPHTIDASEPHARLTERVTRQHACADRVPHSRELVHHDLRTQQIPPKVAARDAEDGDAQETWLRNASIVQNVQVESR